MMGMVAKVEVAGPARLLGRFTTVSLAASEPDVRAASAHTVQHGSCVHVYMLCSELMGIAVGTRFHMCDQHLCALCCSNVCVEASDDRREPDAVVNGSNMKQANFKANKNLAQIYRAAISFHDQLCCELN